MASRYLSLCVYYTLRFRKKQYYLKIEIKDITKEWYFLKLNINFRSYYEVIKR